MQLQHSSASVLGVDAQDGGAPSGDTGVVVVDAATTAYLDLTGILDPAKEAAKLQKQQKEVRVSLGEFVQCDKGLGTSICTTCHRILFRLPCRVSGTSMTPVQPILYTMSVCTAGGGPAGCSGEAHGAAGVRQHARGGARRGGGEAEGADSRAGGRAAKLSSHELAAVAMKHLLQ